jgi:GT2 family glycosyltransferase
MTGRSDERRVVAVVVAYNRRDLLRECLEALSSQTRSPDAIVVIDNASTDGSADVVDDFAGTELIRVPRNTGGAGGFALGIADAVDRRAADLVWVMDDDTVPTATALEELLAALVHAPAATRILASTVRWVDGRDHPMNTPRVRPFARRSAVAGAARFDCYPIRSASFVSLMIDARAVRECGLPVAAYFLWNDDFEYTSRILRRWKGYVARRSVVNHKTSLFGSTDIDPGPRFRFEVRNKIWMLRYSAALAPLERALYVAASLRRWGRTFLSSTDRPTLWQGLRRGIGEGFGAPPAPNEVELGGLGELSSLVGGAGADEMRR